RTDAARIGCPYPRGGQGPAYRHGHGVGVEVTRDLAHAKVFVTVLGDAEARAGSMAALNSAAGFLRHELGQRMLTRTVPQLRFVYDESIERGSALSALIDEAVKSDKHDDED